MDCWQNFSRSKNNARFNSLVTSVDGFAVDVDFGCFVLQHFSFNFCREQRRITLLFSITMIFHKNPRLIFAQNLRTMPASAVTK